MYQDPYAVKAHVQHEYQTDHLNIWLTFPEPMNQTVLPSMSAFVIKADGNEYDTIDIAWQDAYTLLLTSDTIATYPARVLVKFDGPDSNLETTWHKNWEPWGYILSTDITATYLPAGTILIWSGSIATIPTGFTLCDGTLGTPDLQSRFVGCFGPGLPVGSIGGTANHYHTATQAAHNHTVGSGTILQNGTGYSDITDSKTPAITVGQAAHIPPYYILAYIMKL